MPLCHSDQMEIYLKLTLWECRSAYPSNFHCKNAMAESHFFLFPFNIHWKDFFAAFLARFSLCSGIEFHLTLIYVYVNWMKWKRGKNSNSSQIIQRCFLWSNLDYIKFSIVTEMFVVFPPGIRCKSKWKWI